MAKIKTSMMGKHNPSEEEEAARRWCINNNIKISPSAVGAARRWCINNNIKISPSAVGAGTPTRWILVLDLNGKIVNGPDQLAKNEVWIKMYEYYMYYYKKSNQ